MGSNGYLTGRHYLPVVVLLCAALPAAASLLFCGAILCMGGVALGSGTVADGQSARHGAVARMHFALASDLVPPEWSTPPSGEGGAPTSSRSSVRSVTSSMRFHDARQLAAGDVSSFGGLPPDARGPQPVRASRGATGKREGNYAGWVSGPGPGAPLGSRLNMRRDLRAVLTVLLCTELHRSLVSHFDDGQDAKRARTGLLALRESMLYITDKALRQRAYMLSRSGAVGVLQHLGKPSSRLDRCRHSSVAITISCGQAGRVVCSCSEEEQCLDTAGCMSGADMAAAIAAVRTASALSLRDVSVVLAASVSGPALEVGTAVPYGKSRCVVRSGTGSWPFAVVRRNVAGRWICAASPTTDGECLHRSAASEIAAGGYKSDGEGEGHPNNTFGDDDPGGQGARVPSGARAINALPSRYMQVHQSMTLRDLVPRNSAQVEASNLLAAATTGTMIEYEAPEQCPFSLSGMAPGQYATPHDCRVEFFDGSVGIKIFSWRCLPCKYRVMLDGREYGLVFASPCTAYTETFLIEMAVSLSRNGCSLRSSSDLRVGFSELSAPFKYLPDSGRLRSLTTLRRGVIIYLQLVIRGLPAHVSTCSNCIGADGRIDIICFDGFQLGCKVRYKKPFIRASVRTSAIPRASLHAHVITDGAVAKALCTVLNASPHKAVASSRTITTINAIRGWAMAVSVLLGHVPGADPAVLAGKEQHGMTSSSTNRGWDPAKDGGVRPEFTHFLRTVFCCQLVARSLCLDITAASSDLRRRIATV